MKKKFIFIFFLSCFIFSLGTLKVSAATMDFTISPQIPSNQANPDEGFFDLLMPNPGSEQNLQIVFKNISKKKQSLLRHRLRQRRHQALVLFNTLKLKGVLIHL